MAVTARSSATIGSKSGRWRRFFDAWVARRGPTRPPMRLKYRQIFILPTRFGWMLGTLMFAMLMGSLNFNNNLGLLTTFIVAGLASNSMVLAFRNLQHLSITRTGAAPVFAGATAQLMVSLDNPALRARPGLEIKIGEALEIFSMAPQARSEVAVPLPTHHRGWLDPGRIRVQTSHPIGLFEAWSWFWVERPILVWPKPAQSPPPLPDEAADQSGEQRHSRLEGDEFFSLRGWREGDPLHRVAWKASQRHDHLLVRDLRQPRARDLHLNLARTPGRDLEARIAILTAWVLQADRLGRSWTLELGGQSIGPDRGEAHLHACLRALAEL